MFYSRALPPVAAAIASLCLTFTASAESVENLEFVGGCNLTMPTGICDQGGNASEVTIAAILGIDESLVTYLGPARIDRDGNIVVAGSNHDLSQLDVTHLAFKSATYNIVGEVIDEPVSGSTDILDWLPDFSTVTCPTAVCGEERFYELGDFLNGGGNVPRGGSIRAFSVVPAPAALWLLGSALGLLGWLTRRTT
jgi:hypothetical protein